ncbi:MAG: GTP 3',8-cyclase MoaA [Chitinophagaceae bacterium]|nr:GTP 3',8-cyclase MoaA [Chitinophagaceae bacterium]
MLYDRFQRVHNYLRLSLTDACNFRCTYCLPNEDTVFSPSAHLMQTDEIIALANRFVQLGVSKIRLTGGEPLVRKEFKTIVQQLASLNVQLSITTNGMLLHQHIDTLWDAGIRTLNISLDTLQAARFLALTKRDAFEQVFKNMVMALEYGFKVKLNVVVMKGINHTEVIDFVALTKDRNIAIRFIEFMPFDRNQWKDALVFTEAEILETLAQQFTFQALSIEAHATARTFQVEGHQGNFAIISTMTHPFCGDCNRMRLTADGKLKNCLFSKSEVDLLSAHRRGEDIEPLIKQSLLEKEAALGGQLLPDFHAIEPDRIQNRAMIAIGG